MGTVDITVTASSQTSASSSSDKFLYTTVASVINNGPNNVFQDPLGGADVILPGTGSVSASQPLDFDLNPGTSVGGYPALVYNSNTVNVKPIVQITLPTNAGSGVPSTIDMTFIWDPTGADVTTSLSFDTSAGTAGETYLLAAQVGSGNDCIGRIFLGSRSANQLFERQFL